MKLRSDVGSDTGLTIEKRRNTKVRKKIKYHKLDIGEFIHEWTLGDPFGSVDPVGQGSHGKLSLEGL